MIITIDGPAGVGKSTVARKLAIRLGFRHLDTGAMYRAVAMAGIRCGVDWDRPDDLVRIAHRIKIEFVEGRVFLDGEDVTETLRSEQVTGVTKYAADNPQIRQRLVELQREIAERRDIVTEGRDQGSVVFPGADCKIFLTASEEERAKRRLGDMLNRGQIVTFDEVLAEQQLRDGRDSSRSVGPLVRPDGAVEVCTDGMSVDEVVDRLASMACGDEARNV